MFESYIDYDPEKSPQHALHHLLVNAQMIGVDRYNELLALFGATYNAEPTAEEHEVILELAKKLREINNDIYLLTTGVRERIKQNK